MYGQEYGDYNSDGWLSGSWFVGPSADATLFTNPFGPCVADTRYFGVSVCTLYVSIVTVEGMCINFKLMDSNFKQSFFK